MEAFASVFAVTFVFLANFKSFALSLRMFPVLEAVARHVMMDKRLGYALCDPSWGNSHLRTRPDLVKEAKDSLMGPFFLLFWGLSASHVAFKGRAGNVTAATMDDSYILQATTLMDRFVEGICLTKHPKDEPRLARYLLVVSQRIRGFLVPSSKKQPDIFDRINWRRDFKAAGFDDRCDACDRTAVEAGCAVGRLKRCGRCKVAVYCSSACSRKDWKEGGHKAIRCEVSGGSSSGAYA